MGIVRLAGVPLAPLTDEQFASRLEPHADTLARFIAAGHNPHYWQYLAHSSTARWLNLGAGRRGGKTRGAAWLASEFANPTPITITEPDGTERVSTVQREALAKRNVALPAETDAIIGAIVMPEYQSYDATRREFFAALRAQGIPYHFNKTNRVVYLPDEDYPQSIVFLKSASNEDRMVGDGYSWCWWDEAGAVATDDAWNAFRPALSDKRGCGIFSTTPGRKNSNWWYFDRFLDPEAAGRGKEVDEGEYIAWYSVENTYFPRDEWLTAKAGMHPLLFRREYMAKWERGGGEDLKEEWLNYFSDEDLHQTASGAVDWTRYWIYAGVDPAISEAATADCTAAWVLAQDKETNQCYLVEYWNDRLDFPAQLELINHIQTKWQPVFIGVEVVAYQRALEQQAARLPSFPSMYPVKATGRKEERLLALGPAFKYGGVKVRKEHRDFIQQWIEFPRSKHDDLLDAAEIVLRTAGFTALQVAEVKTEQPGAREGRVTVKEAEALCQGGDDFYDEHMGLEW